MGIESGEIAVWSCRVESLAEADLAAMAEVLSEEEKGRRDRFVFAADRRAFTAAHAMLRTALSRYGPQAPRDWRFQATPEGKPFLAVPQAGDPPLRFNLSHTRATVACAIAVGVEVGIDVQEYGPSIDGAGVAERYFTAAERRLLASCPRADAPSRFVELWALKEAYVKATGLGLGTPLDSFEFSFGDPPGLTFESRAAAARWQFWLAAPSPTTRLAVAAPAAREADPWRLSWWHHDGAPAAGVTLLRHGGG